MKLSWALALAVFLLAAFVSVVHGAVDAAELAALDVYKVRDAYTAVIY